MTTNDAYRPPKSNLEMPQQKHIEAILQEPRRCPLSAGKYWIEDAWHLFKCNPLILISMWVIFFLMTVALSIVPVVSILTAFLTPVFTAGFAFSAAKLDHERTLEIQDLFIGFSKNFGALLGIGSLSFLYAIVMLIVAVLLVFIFGASSGASVFPGDGELLSNTVLLLIVLIYLALFLPFLMLTWFAPVLIIQHNVSVWQAMALSFKGCLRNILPFLIFSLIFLGLFIIAMIPLLLGLFVVAPLFMLTFYTAYKDIFLHINQYEASFVA